MPLKEFIESSYVIFQNIRSTSESFEFSDILAATPNLQTYNWTIIGCARVLTMVFSGKVHCGTDITNVLYARIPQDIQMPVFFEKLCEVNNGKYIFKNTDWCTLDFKLAVFDLIDFIDFENKVLFNNKVNEYLKNIKEDYL